MKQATRVSIAAAAAEKITGQPVQRVFDYAEQSALPVTAHVPDADRREPAAPLVLNDEEERVSLRVREDLFTGWDHLTGAYFAGAMYESEVMLFDSEQRRYYRFRIHQAAPLPAPYLASTAAPRLQLLES